MNKLRKIVPLTALAFIVLVRAFMALLFVPGCSQKPPAQVRAVSSAEVKIIMSKVGANPSMGYLTSRRWYSQADQQWLDGTLAPKTVGIKAPVSSLIEGEEVFKCTEWVKVSVALGIMDRPGVSIGEFHYYRDIDGKGHAVIAAIVPGDSYNGSSVTFWDPQLRRSVLLSKKEIESCISWSF